MEDDFVAGLVEPEDVEPEPDELEVLDELDVLEVLELEPSPDELLVDVPVVEDPLPLEEPSEELLEEPVDSLPRESVR